MNKYQHKLRLFIAAGSAAGFLGGWALLAHAGKPVASGALATDTDAAPAVTVPANLPPIDFKALEATGRSGNAQSIAPQSFVPAPSTQMFSRPRMRTGGS